MCSWKSSGYALGFAGDTFNAAWAAQRMLGDAVPVRYVTAVGTDWMSDAMLARMSGAGIDTAFVRRVSGASVGLYVIRLEDGERSFAYWRRDSAATQLADEPGFLSVALKGAGIVLVSGITLAILKEASREALFGALAVAREQGTLVAFDSNYRPALWRDAEAAREAIGRAVALADIALPTFNDEMALFGDASPEATAARIAALGVGEVVVKNGTAPTICRFGAEPVTIPVEHVAKPIDSSGAGDAFNGTFLASRLQGGDGPAAVTAAQVVAAEAVQTGGALICLACPDQVVRSQTEHSGH